MTTHAGCRMYLPTECNFGILQPIYLPPHSVSIPRTEVPIEAIIGVQVKSKTSLVRDYSCRKYPMNVNPSTSPTLLLKRKEKTLTWITDETPGLAMYPDNEPCSSTQSTTLTQQKLLIIGCISYRCCGTFKYILRPWRRSSSQLNSAPTSLIILS